MDSSRRERSLWKRAAPSVFAVLVLLAPAAAREPGDAEREHRVAARRTPRLSPPTAAPGFAPSEPVSAQAPDSPLLLGGGGSRFIVESGPVSFGALEPGLAAEIPAAIRVRVFSASDWTLRFVPTSELRVVEGGEAVPLSRLAWRSPLSGGFVAARAQEPFLVARGSPTGGAGVLVIVDARLALANEDPTGHYACSFRLLLEDL